ncbi:hypothetical protein GCM10010232_25880 [Streptomyces amakusaensis]
MAVAVGEPGRECDTDPFGDGAAGPERLADGSCGGVGVSLTGERPGRGRPSPAGRPAKDSDAVGPGSGTGGADSPAWARGAASSSTGTTARAQRVRRLGATG